MFFGFSDTEEAAKLGVTVSMTQVRSNGAQLEEFGRLFSVKTEKIHYVQGIPMLNSE